MLMRARCVRCMRYTPPLYTPPLYTPPLPLPPRMLEVTGGSMTTVFRHAGGDFPAIYEASAAQPTFCAPFPPCSLSSFSFLVRGQRNTDRGAGLRWQGWHLALHLCFPV